MKKLTSYITILCFALISCNDLSPTVHSTITEDNFFQTERQVLSSAGPAYSGLRTFTQVFGIWGVNEFSSDELVLPTRGQHWDNDGIYRRLQRHEWNTEEGHLNQAWNDIFSGINTTNRLLHQFDQIEDKSEALQLIISELRGIRAFWYFIALDMFGNVPLVTGFADAEAAPKNNTEEEVFNFVEQELLEAIPDLRTEKSSSTYGRFHRWAAYATLAKLYMNAELYTGTSRWSDAEAALDAIIDSGQFSLEDDYLANFAVENEGSDENIFVIPYDNTYTTEWGAMLQFHFWGIHFNGHRAFSMQNGGWDGYAGVPSFVQSFDDADIRKDMWLIGLQTTPSGDTLYCNQELAGEPLIYEVEFNSLENASEKDGARLMKYDYTGAQGWTLSNDFAVYRYADVLLMKAEALMRQNGEAATAEAVELVNQVRARAFEDPSDELYTTSTLTLDALLAERGWEMAGEGWRRHDQNRFGVFTAGSWEWKNPSSETRRIFPIPQQQRSANPNLTQNPGY